MEIGGEKSDSRFHWPESYRLNSLCNSSKGGPIIGTGNGLSGLLPHQLTSHLAIECLQVFLPDVWIEPVNPWHRYVYFDPVSTGAWLEDHPCLASFWLFHKST